ncbi:MAG: hypothetical protein E7270_10105 [Lachnospiraceae bacterium]|nr:hypothetical protein [Lachnospiraceae bacterium]
MKSLKKFFSILLVMLISVNVVACSGEKPKPEDTTKNTTVEDKTTPEETTKEEETTTPEPTTPEETTKKEEVAEDFSCVSGDPFYDFIFNYQEVLVKEFDNKVFNKGDIIDCKADIEAAGYDISEYGKVFSYVYTTIMGGSRKCTLTDIESTYDDLYFIMVVDDSHNLVLKNETEQSFKLHVYFEDDKCIIEIIFIE